MLPKDFNNYIINIKEACEIDHNGTSIFTLGQISGMLQFQNIHNQDSEAIQWILKQLIYIEMNYKKRELRTMLKEKWRFSEINQKCPYLDFK